MFDALDPLDKRLLDDFQRGFPLVPEPFSRIAEVLDTTQEDVLSRLERMANSGLLTRVGAAVRPNTAAVSTLAAMAVPLADVEAVAAIVDGEEGVNHNYLRDHQWNLWFVATAPDRAELAACLDRIRFATGLEVLDLPLVTSFNIDLGFSLSGNSTPLEARPCDPTVLETGDAALLDMLARGLPMTGRPYRELARQVGRSEADVLRRIEILVANGIITRLGVIVRHRAIGWASNAMVVWDVPHDRIAGAGPQLAAHKGVTLCYRRRTVPGVWPYALYSMVHGRSRSEALEVIAGAAKLPALKGVPYQVLFSIRAFKQSGALIASRHHKGRTSHATHAASHAST